MAAFSKYPQLEGSFVFTTGNSESSVLELKADKESESYTVRRPSIVALYFSGVDVLRTAGVNSVRLLFVHTDDVGYPVELGDALYEFVLRTDVNDYFTIVNPAVAFSHSKLALQLVDSNGAPIAAPSDWSVPCVVNTMHA